LNRDGILLGNKWIKGGSGMKKAALGGMLLPQIMATSASKPGRLSQIKGQSWVGKWLSTTGA